jgi:hypothetical protein
MFMMPPSLVPDSGFPLKEGLYDFIHPDVRGVIIPILDNNDFRIELRSFRSLTYNWGTKFANPAQELWKNNRAGRSLINPCMIVSGDTTVAPVIIFGPFKNVGSHKRFRNQFETWGIAKYGKQCSLGVKVLVH